MVGSMWSKRCLIRVCSSRGFSHVFVHDDDEYVDAGGSTQLKGASHCIQQVFDNDYRDAVELNASRLGVKARAAGINLVLITQRPDKDALPMQLRANLTNRLVLKVADKRNSVLVLDEPGAERLLGRGHLAAKLSGEGEIILAQVPFADEDEMAELADLIRSAWSRE